MTEQVQQETGTYSEFSHALHDAVYWSRVPVAGTVEITNRCPLNCAHCYNNLPMGDFVARARELSTEEHCRVLDELADAGTLWLLFTGGEIFARRDFLEIYTHAKKRGFIITLFTNGTMITEDVADYLAQWPPFAIEITLYGATAETYEKLTRIPGSFEKCMRGIRALLDRKLPLSLKTVGVTINKHEIPAMKQIARDLGVTFKFDPMMNPRIDCSASPLAVRLAPHEIVELDFNDPERVAEWRKFFSSFAESAAPDLSDGEMPPVYECGGGQNSFAIDPYGDLSICVLSHVDRYNVRDGSFGEGWNEFMPMLRERKVKRITKCTMCSLRSVCGSCAAQGELENGDADEPVDFLCNVAHLRANVFDLYIRPHGDCEYCEGGEKHEAVRMTAEALRGGRTEELAAIAAIEPAATDDASCGSGACSNCTVR